MSKNSKNGKTTSFDPVEEFFKNEEEILDTYENLAKTLEDTKKMLKKLMEDQKQDSKKNQDQIPDKSGSTTFKPRR